MNTGTGAAEIEVPATLPVMVLGGVTLFPNTLLPLFIFEQRYKAMLENALGTDRLLAIAQPLRENEERLCPVAGVGLIRACVKKEDGSSHLILQGLERVRFTGWPQLVPFRVAAVERVGLLEEESAVARQERLAHLRVILERDGLSLPQEMREHLARIDDPDSLTDIAASALLKDPVERQTILAEASNVHRQELLLRFLREKHS
jgi:Lon protease-like protein